MHCTLCGLSEDQITGKQKQKIADYGSVKSSGTKNGAAIVKHGKIRAICSQCKSLITAEGNQIVSGAWSTQDLYHGPNIDYFWSKNDLDIREYWGSIPIGKTVVPPPDADASFEDLVNYKGIDVVSKIEKYEKWMNFSRNVYKRYESLGDKMNDVLHDREEAKYINDISFMDARVENVKRLGARRYKKINATGGNR